MGNSDKVRQTVQSALKVRLKRRCGKLVRVVMAETRLTNLLILVICEDKNNDDNNFMRGGETSR